MKEQMSELGFEVILDEEFSRIKFDRIQIGVRVEIKFPTKIPFSPMVFKRLTKRSTNMWVLHLSCDDDGLASFMVMSEVPPCFSDVYGEMVDGIMSRLYGSKQIATTFPDFCWQLSEGTNHATSLEVITKVSPKAVLGDLTWILPSKFCDDFIETMHALNMTILEGTMQDAVVYGPLFCR